MKWPLGVGFGAGLAAPPAAPSIDWLTLISIVAGLVTILGGFVAWRKWQNLSAAQREDLEASAAQRAVEALDRVLNRYIEDLERTKAELEAAKTAIVALQADLAAANERIIRLEESLTAAHVDREALQGRLDQALRERAEIKVKLDQNQAAYHATQEKMADLERRVGGRRAQDPT